MKSPFARLAYRSRQFLLALTGGQREVPEEALRPHLSPALVSLFRQMTASEQAHSLAVLERLQAAGASDPDLAAAALLHDAGKARSTLRPFDRAAIVVGKKLLPGGAAGWGKGEAKGWKRAFVVAAQHAEWGAEMAARAGASERTCELIRKHQDTDTAGDRLLQALQEADDLE